MAWEQTTKPEASLRCLTNLEYGQHSTYHRWIKKLVLLYEAPVMDCDTDVSICTLLCHRLPLVLQLSTDSEWVRTLDQTVYVPTDVHEDPETQTMFLVTPV